MQCCLFIAKRRPETWQSTNIKNPPVSYRMDERGKIVLYPSDIVTSLLSTHRMDQGTLATIGINKLLPQMKIQNLQMPGVNGIHPQAFLYITYPSTTIDVEYRFKMQSSNKTSHKKTTDLSHCFKDVVFQLNIHYEDYKPAFESSSISNAIQTASTIPIGIQRFPVTLLMDLNPYPTLALTRLTPILIPLQIPLERFHIL